MAALEDSIGSTDRRSFLMRGTAGVVASAVGLTEVRAAATAGRKFHVAANGDDSASGLSPKKAWKTLDRVNRETFQPGDAVLLRSGDVWKGRLQLQGSGAEKKPIVLGRYGSGPLPVIDMGAAQGAAVLLENRSSWQISEIEVTSGAPADPRIGRQGIVALVTGEGTCSNIVIRGCFIHDVWGTLGGGGPLDMYNSSAIFVGRRQTDRHRTGSVENVLIEGNRIERVDRCGIIVWRGGKGVVIRQNRMENLGGDGIFPEGCDGALVERNIVTRSCLRTGDPELVLADKRYNPHSAAIWLQNCTGGIMQFNEVYDTGRCKGNGDGEAYDFDFGCHDCILQYNYSRNNYGLLLIMQRTSGNIARYNISENDQTHLLALRSNLDDGNLIHNNVFYVDHGTAEIEMMDNPQIKDKTKAGVPLRNNIFYATGQGRFKVLYLSPTRPDPNPGDNRLFLDNCYFGPWVGAGPNDSDLSSKTHDPLFVAPGRGGTGLDSLKGYQFQANSPCLGRGAAIAKNGGRDFWGNPLPAGALDIGAFQHREK